jgi:uncharacterized protein
VKKKKKPLTLEFTPITTFLLTLGLIFVLFTGIFIGMGIHLISDPGEGQEVSSKNYGQEKSARTEADTEKEKEKKEREEEKKEEAPDNKKESAKEEIEKAAESGAKSEYKKKAAAKSRITKGRIAFVIDDVGYNMHELEPFLEIPVKLTFAVLPKLDYTEKAVDAIKKASKSYILHQPMEPLGEENPGPGALYTEMNSTEIEKVLFDNLSTLPGVRGLNNHMGSKATADEQCMKNLFTFLKRKEIFFLDSATTPYSVAEKIAEEFEVPYLRRAVFLDNKDDKEYIERAIQKGLTIANTKGDVVMIGHVWSDYLIEAIESNSKEIEEEGYDVVFLEEIVNRK